MLFVVITRIFSNKENPAEINGGSWNQIHQLWYWISLNCSYFKGL